METLLPLLLGKDIYPKLLEKWEIKTFTKPNRSTSKVSRILDLICGGLKVQPLLASFC
jgi:hypothetical protein